uniref:Uncharacterized protein LOC111100360 n=1 Tax=Crassostrea virginica TaxID=6565 RepID=A0A8B8A8Q2_CRAVI|nr:uncharacterized protein LOC111100360 [Crassostrea virginica]
MFKYLGVFCVCFLLSGARGDFLDDLKHFGDQALHTALDTLSSDGVKTLVSSAVSAAGTALLSSLFGKRATAEEMSQALDMLKQDAETVRQILHTYGAHLQTAYDKIKDLSFLEQNAPEFLNDITRIKGQYNTALDKVVQNFLQKMSQLQHSRKRNLLDGFASAFQGTVEQLKQTFGGVADLLHGSGSGLLTQLTQHLSGATGNLATQLSGLKETAAQLLATGQETLQGAHEAGATAVDQLHSGLTGAGSQLIDQLLHPAGTEGK